MMLGHLDEGERSGRSQRNILAIKTHTQPAQGLSQKKLLKSNTNFRSPSNKELSHFCLGIIASESNKVLVKEVRLRWTYSCALDERIKRIISHHVHQI